MDVSLFNQSVNSNVDSTFTKILDVFQYILMILLSPQTWTIVGIISSVLSIFLISIIIFSLVRLFEIQSEEKHHISHAVAHALAKQQEIDQKKNPRFHYIQTLIESQNESDWRVAIIEADSLLEETLREKGYTGVTTSELLESAAESGYQAMQSAWDAHLIRNQIAHEGSDFPLSQTEGRRVIRMYQNFFEEIGVA
jgi:ABC-type multidrug transport system fused ATPase/permease subunit